MNYKSSPYIRQSRKRSTLTGFTVVILFLTAQVATAQPRFRGYLENRFFATFINNDFALSHLKRSVRTGDYNRARVIMEHSVSDNSSLTIAVDYFTYHGYLQQQLRQPGSGSDPTSASSDQRVVIDRVYMRLTFTHADITIGKQRISWGRSLLWSPLDVFNRVNFFEPQEEKFGINALRVQVPLGITSSIEGVYAPDDKPDNSSSGIRLLWNWAGTEYALTTIHFANPLLRQNIFGFEFKTDKFLGIWFEGAHFNENRFRIPENISASYFRWLIGLDYSFNVRNGLLIMTEYTHDESGEPHKNRYDYSALFTGQRSLLARDYLFSSLQLRYSELTSWSAAFLSNVNDGSLLAMPQYNRLIFEDTELTLGMYIALADKGTEFNPKPESDPANAFGNATFYAWIRLYF